MPAQNDFLPFGTAGGAAVLNNAAYASITPANGFPAGILPKEKLNKALRQAINMASALGGVVYNTGGQALDDGNIVGLTAAIVAALKTFLVPRSLVEGVGQQQAGPNGFQFLPGGFLLQWAVGANASSEAQQTIAFPLAFPTAVFHVGVTTSYPTGDSAVNAFFELVSSNLTGCVLMCQNDASGFSHPVYPTIFAIGN